ncbi:hypothetical protein FI667_g2371, partial [Globisporangium splendens]
MSDPAEQQTACVGDHSTGTTVQPAEPLGVPGGTGPDGVIIRHEGESLVESTDETSVAEQSDAPTGGESTTASADQLPEAAEKEHEGADGDNDVVSESGGVSSGSESSDGASSEEEESASGEDSDNMDASPSKAQQSENSSSGEDDEDEESKSDYNLRPRKKRRAAAIEEGDEEEEDATGAECTDEREEGADDEEEFGVRQVINRRGRGNDRQYLVVWDDGTSEWKSLPALSNCMKLVESCDRYLDKYPNGGITFAEFASRDLPTIRLMADNSKDDCAVHAVVMAFELMELDTEARTLKILGKEFLASMGHFDSKRGGGLKTPQLVKFLREEVPTTGWLVDLDTFGKNLFNGQGIGPSALTLLWEKKQLDDGVYLVRAQKPSKFHHCVAIQVKDEEMLAREDGVTAGIMQHDWIRSISFVRRLRLIPTFASK